MKKVLITSALLYANGPAHFGHIAGAYLPADIYARFARLFGCEVLFLSGSDEYGMPITLSAESAKRSPKEHVDFFHKINLDLFNKLSFSFDHFSRTTWEGHDQTVYEFFEDLKKNGYIEALDKDHLYSEKEQRFLADRYVVGTCPKCGYEKARGDECTSCGANYESLDLKNPRSKFTNSPLILKKSRHYYLRFDLFKDQLESWIQEKPWKENVLNFSKKYIEDLKPRAITRDSEWGVPIDLDDGTKKVFYVWFDAPIGYISAAKDWAMKKGKPDAWKDFWLDPETSLVQFIGKDNIPFHSVFFPAMTMGQNQPYKLVDQIPANEFLRLEGQKFSKSDGHFIDLDRFFEKYEADQIRYYLAANAPETSDADFVWKDFQSASNGDLLGKLGNFVHRVSVFSKKQLNGKIPEKPSSLNEEFIKELTSLWEKIAESYQGFHVRQSASFLMKIASLGNSYFNAKEPWKALKEGKGEEVKNTLYHCFFCMKILSVAAFPIIPQTAEKIWKILGYENSLASENWQKAFDLPLKSGFAILEPKVLFQKIEDEDIQKEQTMLQKEPEKTITPIKEPISFEQFSALDLRVGKILEVEKVPKSKKLLYLSVDIGSETRKVVSGIANAFEPTEILGKKILFVANLKPAKIMGLLSEGMILAAGEGSELELPSIQNMPVGSVVS